MAETLLAILLVTSSAKGSNLVFRWPEHPVPSPRLSRPKPDPSLSLSPLDNPWRASHSQKELEEAEIVPAHNYGKGVEYAWHRPNALRDRSLSFNHTLHHTGTGRKLPSRDGSFAFGETSMPDEYEHVLGYKAEFLTQILCPQKSMCHAKFELVVDDLAFIGHPVCADGDGGWRFKPEKTKTGSRGRDESDFGSSVSPRPPETPAMNLNMPPTERPDSRIPWLQTFHLTLVLDLPDPSSSASGNLSKYFNILYEQIAFTLTAVLYQEQVLSNYVEEECEKLILLKENCISRGEPFSQYTSRALETSSIAPAIKTIYESIKSSDIAYVTINYLPLQLQLPPYIDTLLHSQGDQDADFFDPTEEGSNLTWGESMSLGWKLPAMAPWKTVLLLDIESEMNFKGPPNTEDRKLAEGLIRFLETVSVTLPLYEMAHSLEWDLENQVYPIVRWLVLHRRAKIVDVVHPDLKTVFALPPQFGAPLLELAAKFDEDFPHPAIPPLAQILSVVSTAMSKPNGNHFFASVVKAKEHISMYRDVIVWMLKRDMLVTLHLRIRIVATRELKLRVKADRDLDMAQRAIDTDNFKMDGRGQASFFLSPRAARRFARRLSSAESRKSEISELDIYAAEAKQSAQPPMSSDSSNSEPDEDDSGWDTTEDHTSSTMIDDPGKATPMQQRWLSAMSEGIEPAIARRFELINQYFDGKRSDDEILYRAGISRKQLREVLHHYEEYLQTFLHPS